MKVRTFCCLAIPVLAGFVAYFATTGQLRRAWSMLVRVDPVIDYPAKIDLGEREMGDLAIARFTIANRGGGELVVDQIRTNCSCSGMEREQDGRYLRLENLRLKGGEQADLVMRVSVRGVPIGADMVNTLEFRSNDPTSPTGRIVVLVRRVSGGVFASPQSVAFGTVPVGVQAQHVVDIRDDAAVPRRVAEVTSSRPEQVRARLVPVEDQPQNNRRQDEGTLIGRLEVTVETGNPGDIDATVEVAVEGRERKPDAVRVFGKVVAPVELFPSSLILPRMSSSGPVYSADCICRSTNGKPLSLVLDSAPPGFTVNILDEEEPGARAVRVTWDHQRESPPKDGQRLVIRLRAKAGEDEQILGLPVLLRN